MVNLIINLIIAIIICGFVLWLWTRLKGIIANFVVEPFLSILDFLVYALVGAIVIFYVVIPLIRAAGGALGHY